MKRIRSRPNTPPEVLLGSAVVWQQRKAVASVPANASSTRSSTVNVSVRVGLHKFQAAVWALWGQFVDCFEFDESSGCIDSDILANGEIRLRCGFPMRENHEGTAR